MAMATSSNLSTPNIPKKMASTPGLGTMSQAPSLLSLRSVIDFMPNNIRLRYKDAAKYVIWPECPLDGNGNAVDFNESGKLSVSTSGLAGSTKLKRNFTLNSAGISREYSKFGNAPVFVNTNLKPSSTESSSTPRFGGISPFQQRKLSKSPKGPSVAYFSSKDGGDVSVRLLSTEMTKL